MSYSCTQTDACPSEASSQSTFPLHWSPLLSPMLLAFPECFSSLLRTPSVCLLATGPYKLQTFWMHGLSTPSLFTGKNSVWWLLVGPGSMKDTSGVDFLEGLWEQLQRGLTGERTRLEWGCFHSLVQIEIKKTNIPEHQVHLFPFPRCWYNVTRHLLFPLPWQTLLWTRNHN